MEGKTACSPFSVLRPLRPLREIIKIKAFFHAKSAKSAEFNSPFVFHACAGVVANFVTTKICDNLVKSVSSVGDIVLVSVFVLFIV